MEPGHEAIYDEMDGIKRTAGKLHGALELRIDALERTAAEQAKCIAAFKGVDAVSTLLRETQAGTMRLIGDTLLKQRTAIADMQAQIDKLTQEASDGTGT